jgi:hypothetical protein
MLAALAFALGATYPEMPRRWRIVLIVVSSFHAAPLLITVWRYALLGGVVD